MWRSESVDIVYDWCPPMTAIHEKDKKKKEFFHLLMLTYDYTEIPRIRRSVNGEIFHTWVPTYYYNSWEGWREVRVGKSFLHGCPPITTIPEKDVENWELGNLSYMGAHCPVPTYYNNSWEGCGEERARGNLSHRPICCCLILYMFLQILDAFFCQGGCTLRKKFLLNFLTKSDTLLTIQGSFLGNIDFYKMLTFILHLQVHSTEFSG